MTHLVLCSRRQRGAQIIEYSLIITLISLALAAALGGAIRGVPGDICALSDRVSRLMGGQGVVCS